MKIKNIVSQYRRDFQAIYECEHCGHTKEGSGYDDENFHQNVIPKMKYLKYVFKHEKDIKTHEQLKN